MIRVQKEDFDIGIEISQLTAKNTEIGGLGIFVGLVRDHAGDEKITSMTLEHYPGMTEKHLKRLEVEARERWPLQDVLIIHRHGKLVPGERIVLVVTASSHRESSLESCQFLIDRLKTKAPFWKLENMESGAKWVEPLEEDCAASDRWLRMDKR
ncbi:MAG: Molybdopterin synthase catalytic subunit [Alphaproteobacteria bacterium MarineAlpha11_Bin1]|nr:MAG: Molybdopterin synthase catalytic subunit [Alphaproteobacteria bacterium MarineAlpha11_Bin1]|tara:strand:- start:1536 stop:1997 length:462 start_codon:yes stop_codon:yes gene_type:complete